MPSRDSRWGGVEREMGDNDEVDVATEHPARKMAAAMGKYGRGDDRMILFDGMVWRRQ
jgi:hypothetical protein